MNDTCTKCGEKYDGEGHLQLSHDVPRWMGGVDLDGRRYLCVKCHKNYDKQVLNDCLSWIGLQRVEEEKDIIYWQKKLSGLTKINPGVVEPFQDIAKKNKVRWFG